MIIPRKYTLLASFYTGWLGVQLCCLMSWLSRILNFVSTITFTSFSKLLFCCSTDLKTILDIIIVVVVVMFFIFRKYSFIS